MSHTVVGHRLVKSVPTVHGCEPSGEGPTSLNVLKHYNVGDLVRCDQCGQVWYCYDYALAGRMIFWREATWWDRQAARKVARKARREANQRVRDLA